MQAQRPKFFDIEIPVLSELEMQALRSGVCPKCHADSLETEQVGNMVTRTCGQGCGIFVVSAP